MGNRFASGKNSIAMCDRCGFQFKLTTLRKEIKKTKIYNLLVCPECWDPDQPQLLLGMYPVDDPQAVREPRRDSTYYTAGTNGLQTVNSTSNAPDAAGFVTGGSRDIQWGWAPVGGASGVDAPLTPNYLVAVAYVGTVTIS
tara:strand:+ start:126 stop:548 length:423 start_codon:yes stop_codon:yes gene_type:complete